VDGQLDRFAVLLAHPVAAVAHADCFNSRAAGHMPGQVPATTWETVGSADGRPRSAAARHGIPPPARLDNQLSDMGGGGGSFEAGADLGDHTAVALWTSSTGRLGHPRRMRLCEVSMRRTAGRLGTLDRCGLTGCAGLASCPDDDRLVVALQ
jgi:hypothetical protein